MSEKSRSESSSNESIILDFSKLKPYDLEPVCKPHIFSSESQLESEAEEQGRIRNTDWCQCGELLPKKACAVRTLTKFLKNYLKGKNALQNQVGSEWFAWKNQYYILHYQPLII